jgi:N-acetylmuramoyl-L-alanine amidase
LPAKKGHSKATSSDKAVVSDKVKHGYRDVVVVIDPGHGGKDPGAVGGQHTQEKHVVLQIAKRLKAMVNRQLGMKAYLTRRGDYYVPLRRRLALARKYKADIFISIHADAYLNRRSHGASVFSLSQRGATSEAARWIAAKENYSELGGVDLSELDDDNGVLRSVLIDLSQTATIGSSLSLGEKVLGDLDDIAELHHKKVEQARFVVLKSPDIPSILVETGFISNYSEERLLRSKAYQNKLATSILKGIRHYFKERPPRGSLLASHATVYKVVRGDTLSGIAHKFKVSMMTLKKVNKLMNTKLSIGQKLKVIF